MINIYIYISVKLFSLIIGFLDISDPGIEDSFGSSVGSLSEVAQLSHSDNLEVPWGGPSWPMEMSRVLSSSTSEGDSGFGGPPSPYNSACGSFLLPYSRSNTPSSNSSRQGKYVLEYSYTLNYICIQ